MSRYMWSLVVCVYVCFIMQDLETYRQVEFDEVAEYCRSIKCPLVEASAKVSLDCRLSHPSRPPPCMHHIQRAGAKSSHFPHIPHILPAPPT